VHESDIGAPSANRETRSTRDSRQGFPLLMVAAHDAARVSDRSLLRRKLCRSGHASTKATTKFATKLWNTCAAGFVACGFLVLSAQAQTTPEPPDWKAKLAEARQCWMSGNYSNCLNLAAEAIKENRYEEEWH